MNILGLSFFYHDSAAALIKDGKLVACAQEERFTRIKHDFSFPANAINFCLKEGKITAQNLDYVGFYEKPLLKWERILFTYLATFPKSLPSFLKSMPLWLKEKLFISNLIKKKLDYYGKILFIEHHLSHCGSCFLISPFSESAILTIDGVGEWATATYGKGVENQIEIFQEIHFPHSLGLLYSAFTYFLGFKVNSGEHKVMGLSAYGQPHYVNLIKDNLINIKEDGSFQLNMEYFAYDYGLTMTNRKFEELLGAPFRKPESVIDQKYKDIAASLQKVTEEVMLKMAQHLYRETKSKNLCMAGGVALNCVANGRILKETKFENIFIQPAAGDAGGAVGTAFYIYNSILNNKRDFIWEHAFRGPEFSDFEIRQFLTEKKIAYKEYNQKELIKTVAGLLNKGKVMGWFQGRMEFGPRALGNRSILADPRDPQMKDIVNEKIKRREGFRPFAPAVLEEKVGQYFELNSASPYMLLVAKVKEDKKNLVPAITHIDGTARIQTVKREENPLFYALISEFEKQSGVPLVLNTSFNLRGEPIVCTPEDALLCFLRSELDFLVLGSFLIDKRDVSYLAEKEKQFVLQLD